jgi:hypothetical protein
MMSRVGHGAFFPFPREAAGRVARRSVREGGRGGGLFSTSLFQIAPRRRPLPAARKSSRGEGRRGVRGELR